VTTGDASPGSSLPASPPTASPTPSRGVALAARAASVVAPLVAGAVGLACPDSVLVGGLGWLAALMASLAGYGHLAERVARVRLDAGMRLAWGIAVYIMIGGWLLAAGVLTHAALAGLVAIGAVAYAVRELTVPVPTLIAAARALPGLGRERHRTAFLALIVAIAAVNTVGAVARQHGNVYDDDIVYTPMVQRLLDAGDLDEPFSFRRISAYGGQTVFQALAAVRGTLANLYLIDGALCQIAVLLLIAGLARGRAAGPGRPHGPRVDDLVVGLVLLVVVLLPDTSINTASYWSGVVLFLALYRSFLQATGDGATPRLFAAIGILAAGICSLRQNYLPVAGLFGLLVLLARLLPAPRAWRSELPLWIASLLGGLVALAPYCLATWQSNDTFLYPLVNGTFNPDIQMQPALFSAWQELQFFIKVLLEPDPYRATLVLVPVLFFARDTRPGRPFTAFAIASAIGFVLLVHSFTLSDARNLWRYSFGYTGPLLVILLLEGAAAGLRSRTDPTTGLDVPLIGRVVIVVSLLVQLAVSGRAIASEYDGLAADVEQAIAGERQPVGSDSVASLYRAAQAATPAGATVAVMLDEPVHLDYARNRIINIDLPGFASYAPGMPFFRGADAVARYFSGHGIRYLAFVRGDASRYMYRRDYWLQRLFWDTELWRVMGAYTVDCIDNFTAIAADHRILFERDGVVVIDLGAPR
jgi:hypothetical protein